MKTALVIEDNVDIRENTTEILELTGYTVITATNGKEGVVLATNSHPDVILCDILMPKMNGYDVIKQLKTNSITAKIPFIYLTASAEKNEMKMAMDMGANGYVSKPFDIRELMEAIDKALKSNASV
jgi:CheY-like chemotaxis protein